MGELLQLAAESDQLTLEARTALKGELAKRRLNATEHRDTFLEPVQYCEAEDQEDPGTPFRLVSQSTADFIAEVLRWYRGHLWLFVKLIAPAVFVGTAAVITGRHEGREIARNFPRYEILQHRTEYFEIMAANAGGWFVSWIAFCFSFAAICLAVREIGMGGIPAVRRSFARVRERFGAFFRLSILLLLLLFVSEVLGGLISFAVLWALPRGHIRPLGPAFWLATYGCMGIALLVFSRFALAMPALILGDYPVGKAIFRSDELTERKWLVLAVLLLKSLVGGYIAGMLPFWLARFIPADVSLPSSFPWILTIASVIGVTLIEPILFIGFALLYLKTSAAPSQAHAVTA